MKKSQKRVNRKIIFSVICIALLATVTLFISYGSYFGIPSWQDIYTASGIYPETEDGLSVSFIDVGQADSIYISCGQYNMLIDAGYDMNAEQVTAFLDRNNVKTLDIVIATHPDSDHIGGMSAIIDNYQIENFCLPQIEEQYITYSDSYTRMLSSLETYDVDITYIDSDVIGADESQKTLDNLTVDFLSPATEFEDTNDDSVVVKVTYGDVKFLFMGDASSTVEEYLIENNVDVSADVLKVSHHGSRTATSDEFLSAVNPSVAVISSGELNTYNLPNVEILRRLEDFGCKIFRTDLQGTITVTCNNGKITVQSEK